MDGRIETVLSVDEIRVKAHHGWYESERKIGGMYRIAVKIYDQNTTDENFSNIDDTVNYELIYDAVISLMKQEFKLIEECCKALWDALKPLKPDAIWEVNLVKEDVPIKFIGSTSFTIKA